MSNLVCNECKQSVIGELHYRCSICGNYYHSHCASATSVETGTDYIDICPHCMKKRGIKSQIEKINKAYAKMEQAQFRYSDCIKELEEKIQRIK